MKKICFAAALLLLMFCFSVLPASAKEYQENGYEYSLYGKEAVIEKAPNVKGHIHRKNLVVLKSQRLRDLHLAKIFVSPFRYRIQ